MASSDSICIKEELDGTSSSLGSIGQTEELRAGLCQAESTTAASISTCIKQETQDASFCVLPQNNAYPGEVVISCLPAASMSEAQKLLLLSLMEESPELCNNRSFMPGESKQQRRAKWDRIAAALNAIGVFKKDGIGWQLLWKNWRYRVRKNIRSNMNGGTGGGAGTVGNNTTGQGEEGRTRAVDHAANRLDSRVMALVGWDTATAGIPGSSNVSVLGTMTQREATVADLPPPAEEPVPEEPMQVNPEPAASAAPPDSGPGHQNVQVERANTNQRPVPCRRRRRRVPAPIAQQILGLQRELVNEVALLRETITSAMAPISDYFKYKLEKERHNS